MAGPVRENWDSSKKPTVTKTTEILQNLKKP